MSLQKIKLTNRKFYGKWLYKASFNLEGGALFRSKTLDEVEEFCLGPNPHDKHSYSIWVRAWNNRELINNVCTFLKSYSKDVYNLRIESSIFDVYTNDKEFYNLISLEFEETLRHKFEPSEANIDLLKSNQNYITVDRLPKGQYNYRVYLLPHKMKGDKEGKQKYLEWIKRQTPKITCTPSIEKWFLATDWNWDRRYVLVEDESTLLMLKLRNAEVMGRVYNFVVSDK
jgi:hypothetical protein